MKALWLVLAWLAWSFLWFGTAYVWATLWQPTHGIPWLVGVWVVWVVGVCLIAIGFVARWLFW
jgi:hypothetical protein